MKNRFKPNDQVEFLKFNKAIRSGVITKGPVSIDGTDHYVIRWNEDPNTGLRFDFFDGEEIICDLPSAKYRYRLAD